MVVADPFDAQPVGAGQVFGTVIPEWIRENLDQQLVDAYNLGDLFVSDFQGVLYWTLRQGLDWHFGDVVGRWIYDAIRAGDVVANIEVAPTA